MIQTIGEALLVVVVVLCLLAAVLLIVIMTMSSPGAASIAFGVPSVVLIAGFMARPERAWVAGAFVAGVWLPIVATMLVRGVTRSRRRQRSAVA